MLKPRAPQTTNTESLSDLFGQAKGEAVAWVTAEVALYQTIATEKAKAWQAPLALFAGALFFAHAALLVLVATLFVALAQLMNPALAGLLSAVILVVVAGVLAKVALSKIKAASK